MNLETCHGHNDDNWALLFVLSGDANAAGHFNGTRQPMIDRKDAEQKQVRTLDSGSRMTADQQRLNEQLQALLPNLINNDGLVDSRALADALGSVHSTGKTQGYELTFAGKSLARAQATEPTTMELHCEPEQSKQADSTGNVIIRGDNLDALKILYQNYYGKIKMIYIDPPYNTQTENFIYKDNFKQSDVDLAERYNLSEDELDFLHNVYGTRSHSGWLSFMYPRLKLARDLLTEDGVIFISIDDNEQANLKIICDEIFGEANFVGTIAWESKTKSQNTSDSYDKLQPKIEYILCYSMSQKPRFNLVQSGKREYPEQDERGQFRYALIEQMSAAGMRARESMQFPILDVQPNENSQWKIGKSTIGTYEKRGDLVLREGKPYRKMRPQDERMEQTDPFWAFFPKTMGTAESAKKELKDIMDTSNHGFDSVKPVSMIERLIFHVTGAEGTDTSEVEDIIIMDCFAGSGTTGHAVMQINAEDGKQRKFILAQKDEEISATDQKWRGAHTFCTDNQLPPVISSICIERLNRAGDKINQEVQGQTDSANAKPCPDIGYKVFSLIPKPQLMQHPDADGGQTRQADLDIQNRRNTVQDTLVNMLAATCKPLYTRLQCIEEDKLYQAMDDPTNGELYLLADVPRETLEQYRDHKINLDGWANISLTQFLNLGVHNRENITVIY